jgi:hypothetical protein
MLGPCDVQTCGAPLVQGCAVGAPAGQEDGGGKLEGLLVLVDVDNHLWQRQERPAVVGGRRDLPWSAQARRTRTWTRSCAGCSSAAASVEAAVAMEAAAAALSWGSSGETRGEDGVAGSGVQHCSAGGQLMEPPFSPRTRTPLSLNLKTTE